MLDLKILSDTKDSNISLIEVALEDFVQKYAWDKSLIDRDTIHEPCAQAPDYVHSNTYLDEFLESYKQKLAVEQHREVAKV